MALTAACLLQVERHGFGLGLDPSRLTPPSPGYVRDQLLHLLSAPRFKVLPLFLAKWSTVSAASGCCRRLASMQPLPPCWQDQVCSRQGRVLHFCRFSDSQLGGYYLTVPFKGTVTLVPPGSAVSGLTMCGKLLPIGCKTKH